MKGWGINQSLTSSFGCCGEVRHISCLAPVSGSAGADCLSASLVGTKMKPNKQSNRKKIQNINRARADNAVTSPGKAVEPNQRCERVVNPVVATSSGSPSPSTSRSLYLKELPVSGTVVTLDCPKGGNSKTHINRARADNAVTSPGKAVEPNQRCERVVNPVVATSSGSPSPSTSRNLNLKELPVSGTAVTLGCPKGGNSKPHIFPAPARTLQATPRRDAPSGETKSATRGIESKGEGVPRLVSVATNSGGGPTSVSHGHSSGPANKKSWKSQVSRDQRNAERIRAAVSVIPAAERTPEQARKLEWASGVLSRITKSTGSDSTSKRNRSLEGDKPEPKRQKVLSSSTTAFNKDLSFSDALKGKIIAAVIDRSHVDGNISHDQWADVKAHLGFRFLSVIEENPGPLPDTADAGWYQNRIKLIACGDQRSFDLYRTAVNGLPEVWPGAKLEVVTRENIPCRPRARIMVPALHNCPDMIMKLIKTSNPNLPTHDWKVPKVEKETVGRYRSALLVINRESLAPLAATEGVIRYGFDEITVRIYKKDEDSLNAPPIEAPSAEGNASPPPEMEVDATPQVEPSTSAPPNKPSDVEAHPIVDSISDMETEDAILGSTLSEEDLLHSSSDDDNADKTVVEVDPTKSSNAAISSD